LDTYFIDVLDRFTGNGKFVLTETSKGTLKLIVPAVEIGAKLRFLR